MSEVTKIIIGYAVIILISVGFLFMIGEGVSVYGNNVVEGSVDNSSLVFIQSQASELSENINATQQDLVGIKSNPNILDFLGFFFNAGYTALTGITTSVEVGNAILDDGVDVLVGGSAYGGLVKAMAMLIIVVVIIGILIRAITKVDT